MKNEINNKNKLLVGVALIAISIILFVLSYFKIGFYFFNSDDIETNPERYMERMEKINNVKYLYYSEKTMDKVNYNDNVTSNNPETLNDFYKSQIYEPDFVLNKDLDDTFAFILDNSKNPKTLTVYMVNNMKNCHDFKNTVKSIKNFKTTTRNFYYQFNDDELIKIKNIIDKC